MGGEPGDRPGYVDRIRFGFFVDAGLLTRALCGGTRWKLLQSLFENPSQVPFSACLTSGARRRGPAVLLFLTCGSNLGAGSHSHSAAIHSSSLRNYRPASAPPRYAAPLPHVALSDSCDIGDLRLHLHSAGAKGFHKRNSLCLCNSDRRNSSVHAASLAFSRLALSCSSIPTRRG